MVFKDEYSFEAKIAKFKLRKDIIKKSLSEVKEGVSCHPFYSNLKRQRLKLIGVLKMD
jgi:hypothetical protein